MFTRILPSSFVNQDHYVLSNDHHFAILIKESQDCSQVDFSVCLLDHKKYSKVNEGRLYKMVNSISLKDRMAYQFMYCLSPDNSLFCFIVNGFWAGKSERFCDVFIFKCFEESHSFKLDKLLMTNIIKEVETFKEISYCKFNLTADKLLLVY